MPPDMRYDRNPQVNGQGMGLFAASNPKGKV